MIIYIHIYMCTCIFACWNVYTCIHMYIYIYIYIHIYTHIRYMYIVYVSTLFLQHFFYLNARHLYIYPPGDWVHMHVERSMDRYIYIYIVILE